MLYFFLIFSTLSWGLAEIFYKKGNTAEEPYAHLKTTVFVGFFFGAYALVILLTQGVSLKDFPKNFLLYLPVAACYIISMICSYFGVRYIKESISDPIENTSCAFVPLLCAIFLHQRLGAWTIVAIILVVIGILGAGLFDRDGLEERKQSYGKKLAFISIAMPFGYMILDAIGTFLDIYYTEDIEATLLVGVTEENLEHTANCCYELTFFLVAIGILIFLKCKHVKLFEMIPDVSKGKNGLQVQYRSGLWSQRNKIFAALFETAGQATYLFALSEGTGIAAVILGAGTVIISFILSRIILREKLSVTQYAFIGVIFAGIIILSLAG